MPWRKLVHVLLIEDNLADVRLAREAIKDAKLRINLHHVADGEEAIDFLLRRGKYKDAPRPELILLDLNLPKMNGSEVLRIIKNEPVLKLIPVVILTSSNSEEDVHRTYDLHANCYIRKPVDFELFTEVVKEINNFFFSIVRLPQEVA